MFYMKILIVDDIDTLRLILSSCVAALFPDAHILQAENGNQAISVIDKEQPQLVLCDYDMPEGNGGSVFSHLKEKYPNTRFILASSWSPGELKEFKGHKVVSLQKPYMRVDVMAAVKEALK